MHQLSPLESLPAEILVQVMTSATSLNALCCLISTSSTLYRFFKSARRAILSDILIEDLGPAFQDVVAAVLIEPLRPFDDEDRFRWIEACRYILNRDVAQVVGGLTFRDLTHLLPLYRDLSSFVIYAASQCLVEREPHSAYDELAAMTLLDRQLYAQAFVRNQILAQLTFELRDFMWQDEKTATHRAISDKFQSLFEPWERDLIVDVGQFLTTMSYKSRKTYRDCDRFREKWRKDTYARYRECPRFYIEMEDAYRYVTEGDSGTIVMSRMIRPVEEMLGILIAEQERIYSPPPCRKFGTKRVPLPPRIFEEFWRHQWKESTPPPPTT